MNMNGMAAGLLVNRPILTSDDVATGDTSQRFYVSLFGKVPVLVYLFTQTCNRYMTFQKLSFLSLTKLSFN